MFRDFVLIEKNRKKVEEFGRSLGFREVIFIDKKSIIRDIKKVKNLKSKREGEIIIVEGGTDEINKAAVENKRVDILLNPEPKTKDSLHQRNSGLNQVLCKLAKKNNVAYGISFSRLLEGDYKLIGKIMQNIRLCRKYKVKLVFGSFARDIYEMRNVKDLISLARVLGMSPLEAKNSFLK
jgi:ribonuclease P/MRP protein subunit RPP1